jgi:hypothetical protein
MTEIDIRYCKAAIQSHNDFSQVRSPNFRVVNIVLFTEHRKRSTCKLQVK